MLDQSKSRTAQFLIDFQLELRDLSGPHSVCFLVGV